MNVIIFKQKILSSRLFKDSFWAVVGNGMGNALMLLSGILIARFLGKDVYGEYGVVKSTMFYIASFSTFGLGFTSTKYIASFIVSQKRYAKCIARDSIRITLGFSISIAIILFIIAQPLANFIDEPSLSLSFRALAVIVIFKALTTTLVGLLAGFKNFKVIAKNNVLSGLFLLLTCAPLSYYCGLLGSLIALLSSQIFNAAINTIALRKYTSTLVNQEDRLFLRELITFSLPVALQESSFTLCHWTAIMLLTKYSSTGELGLYTAAAQWNAIIMMIPSLLSNVVLSYLSSSFDDFNNHTKLLKKVLIINIVTTVVPFICVFTFSEFISSFYGQSFTGLSSVLKILTFATIFEACSSVFKSEFMALGRTWLLFVLRLIRDLALILCVYFILTSTQGVDGAIYFSWVTVSISVLFLLLCIIGYISIQKKRFNLSIYLFLHNLNFAFRF